MGDQTMLDDPKKSKNSKKIKSKNKAMKEIQNEIRGIIRQITSSVTFLPLLEVPCSFDIQVHTDKQCMVPKLWQESASKKIANAESVRLRSFNTKVHKVDAMVSYKVNDDEDEEDEQEDDVMMHHDENTNIQSLINSD